MAKPEPWDGVTYAVVPGPAERDPTTWYGAAWIQTYTGKAFTPLQPVEADIDPLDISHALGMLCRYGGHTRRFYSVAEHCCHIADWIGRQGGSTEDMLWGLLHDATEAYMQDLVRPIKRALPEYSRLEDVLMASICSRFGLPLTPPPCVKEADNRILFDEKRQLLTVEPKSWDLGDLKPLGVVIGAWEPARAEQEYLYRFRRLTGLI